MSKMEFDYPAGWQEQLDRLVDGELGEAERRELLSSFDTHPGAWRRCALAFLEAQSWQKEIAAFGALAEAPRSHPAADAQPSATFPVALTSTNLPSQADGRGPAPLVPAPSAAWQMPNLGLPLAMAATFLVAFGLAWVVRPAQHAVDQPGTTSPAVGTIAAAMPAPGAVAPSGQSDPWNTVTLVMDDGGRGEREIQYPVIDSTDGDEHWLTERQPVVPRELREALERLGHQVNERRQFVPVDLEDGRRMVVPVDEVQFTPVSARSYQ